MRTPLILTLSLTALLVSGCSRGPKSQFSIELDVDGRKVLKESAEGKKADRLADQHREVMGAVERACRAARFVQQQISTPAVMPAMSTRITESSVAQAKARDAVAETTEVQSMTEIGLVIEPPEGQVVVCTGADDAKDAMLNCSLQPAQSRRQIQYGLQVMSLLQARYGMKSQALYQVRSAGESASGERYEVTDEVRITADRLSCKSSTRLQRAS